MGNGNEGGAAATAVILLPVDCEKVVKKMKGSDCSYHFLVGSKKVAIR